MYVDADGESEAKGCIKVGLYWKCLFVSKTEWKSILKSPFHMVMVNQDSKPYLIRIEANHQCCVHTDKWQ